jgi:hypothetical protein
LSLSIECAFPSIGTLEQLQIHSQKQKMVNFAEVLVEVLSKAVELSKEAPPYVVFSLFFTTFIASLGFVGSLDLPFQVRKLIMKRFMV